MLFVRAEDRGRRGAARRIGDEERAPGIELDGRAPGI